MTRCFLPRRRESEQDRQREFILGLGSGGNIIKKVCACVCEDSGYSRCVIITSHTAAGLIPGQLGRAAGDGGRSAAPADEDE